MFNEINVRAEVTRVESLNVRPIRKTRMLLSIAKRAKIAAGRLVALSQQYYGDNDPLCGARFREAAERLLQNYRDIRQRAGEALRVDSQPLGFGYEPRGSAYPKWSLQASGPLRKTKTGAFTESSSKG